MTWNLVLLICLCIPIHRKKALKICFTLKNGYVGNARWCSCSGYLLFCFSATSSSISKPGKLFVANALSLEHRLTLKQVFTLQLEQINHNNVVWHSSDLPADNLYQLAYKCFFLKRLASKAGYYNVYCFHVYQWHAPFWWRVCKQSA